jgi:hypothetical protein
MADLTRMYCTSRKNVLCIGSMMGQKTNSMFFQRLTRLPLAFSTMFDVASLQDKCLRDRAEGLAIYSFIQKQNVSCLIIVICCSVWCYNSRQPKDETFAIDARDI